MADSSSGTKLLLTRDAVTAGEWSSLRSRHLRGETARVRPGAYADADGWAALSPAERHRMRVSALLLTRDDLVLCDESAGMLWGLPMLHRRHDRVTVMAKTIEGGRSRGWLVKRATVAEREVVQLGEVQLTSAAQTVVDLCRRLPFAEGLMVVDHALRNGLVTEAEIGERLRMFARSRGSSRARRVLSKADGRAESPLESFSRASMIDLGLPPDDLQHPLRDAEGCDRRADFWWERLRLVGECDGRAKYEDPAMLAGRTPADVLWEEKRREDSLRLTGCGFVRWGWAEATRPDRLRTLLAAAGLR